ncbi:MAG: tripartite tricarboxylate transporter permease [Proteobacteria bacterium]|nr:tripartite tricarboxylate transporter permease [Pseudomonadota bacterium]
MALVLQTLLNIAEPLNLLALMIGVIGGMIVGAIPGMTVTMAVALSVPFTISMGPTPSLLLLLGIYCAGTYGGSISAILLNAPGTPANAATVFDGYELAKQGKAYKALLMAIIASVYGGLFSALVLIVVASGLAEVALRFGPAEIAMLVVFSLTVVGVLSGESMAKGLLAAAIGMGMATVGTDPMVGTPRFTFGIFDLYDGFAYIPLLIGLFALNEMFVQAEGAFRTGGAILPLKGADPEGNRVTGEDLRRSLVPMIRSGFLGVFIGILPGLGSAIATFLGYAETKRASKEPERFGKGAIEGVAASEAANNAVTGGALVPLLALSIPGDGVTAIMLGAFLIQGVTPGPLIFIRNPEIVDTVYLGVIAANVMMGVVALFALKPMTAVLKVPKVVLYPVVLMICVAGSYAIRNNLFDVFVMLGAGVLGYGLRLFSVPVPPLLIAFILTRPLEESMRQALVSSEGDPLVFLSSPISTAFALLAVAAVLYTGWRARRGRPLPTE